MWTRVNSSARYSNFLACFIPRGISANANAHQAILAISAPMKIKDVQHFLGVCNITKNHIPGRVLMEPITRLTKKDVKFAWEEVQETSFKLINEKVAQAIMLRYPDPAKIDLTCLSWCKQQICNGLSLGARWQSHFNLLNKIYRHSIEVHCHRSGTIGSSRKSFTVATSQCTPIIRTPPSKRPNGVTLVLRELWFNFKTNSEWSLSIFLERRTWLLTVSADWPLTKMSLSATQFSLFEQ